MRFRAGGGKGMEEIRSLQHKEVGVKLYPASFFRAS